jgi:hypothetical protein
MPQDQIEGLDEGSPPAPTFTKSSPPASSLDEPPAHETPHGVDGASAALTQARTQAQFLEARVAELQTELSQAREALDAAERRHQVDLLLIEAEAIDLESARLLTELAINQSRSTDLRGAVGDLRRRKPFLFRARHAGVASRASATLGPASPPTDPADEAAQEAASTGDRTALLRYLRAKRGE